METSPSPDRFYANHHRYIRYTLFGTYRGFNSHMARVSLLFFQPTRAGGRRAVHFQHPLSRLWARRTRFSSSLLAGHRRIGQYKRPLPVHPSYCSPSLLPSSSFPSSIPRAPVKQACLGHRLARLPPDRPCHFRHLSLQRPSPPPPSLRSRGPLNASLFSSSPSAPPSPPPTTSSSFASSHPVFVRLAGGTALLVLGGTSFIWVYPESIGMDSDTTAWELSQAVLR